MDFDMKNLWLITKADFINLIKNPMWIFYGMAFPILLVAIVGYLTHSAYGNEVTSYDYYGVTLMIYSALSSGMTSANSFMEERIRKANMRIIYAPGDVRSIYLSKIIASFLFSFLLHMADAVFLALVFHINYHAAAYLIVLLALIELFAVTLGIMMCCIFKTESMTNQIQGLLVNLLALLGGTLFSLDGYGRIARAISQLSPVKWIVDASFQLIYDNDFHLFIPTIGIMTGSILLMLLICKITFRKENCIC